MQLKFPVAKAMEPPMDQSQVALIQSAIRHRELAAAPKGLVIAGNSWVYRQLASVFKNYTGGEDYSMFAYFLQQADQILLSHGCKAPQDEEEEEKPAKKSAERSADSLSVSDAPPDEVELESTDVEDSETTNLESPQAPEKASEEIDRAAAGVPPANDPSTFVSLMDVLTTKFAFKPLIASSK